MPHGNPKPKPTFQEQMERNRQRYGTYDPKADGFGNAKQWRKSFMESMGIDEASQILGARSPLELLGFMANPTLQELKKRYRELMLQHHPDRGGDPAKAREIIAAYTRLKEDIE